MLAFIDEAGDTGLKTNQGASQFFVVVMVLFEDHEEAQRCDQRISDLPPISWTGGYATAALASNSTGA